MYIGIDGGGSTVRVVVAEFVEDEPHVVGMATGESVNPSVVGHTVAAQRIEAAVRAAMAQAGVTTVRAVAAGIAGASRKHSEVWLRETLSAMLPGAAVVPSSDFEIALVAAHGRREGVLILAGTGSVAYGINTQGVDAQVGGWGYLLGDEGSGYWIGLEALRHIARAADGREGAGPLRKRVLAHLKLDHPADMIAWVYGEARNPEIAALAPVVMELVNQDMMASSIIQRAAGALATHAQTVIQRLKMHDPPIAFTGGLLSQPNPLGWALCQQLGLDAIPVPRSEPVVGAVLLAYLMEG
jgi:glucosamine kinase